MRLVFLLKQANASKVKIDRWAYLLLIVLKGILTDLRAGKGRGDGGAKKCCQGSLLNAERALPWSPPAAS